MTTPFPYQNPIAIGGVGGSGTRLIASILQELGYYMGSDLNEANDNLWFTLLLKRRELWPFNSEDQSGQQACKIFINAMTNEKPWEPSDIAYINSLYKDRPRHSADWLKERSETLLQCRVNVTQTTHWGWKEPNTHIALPLLLEQIPKLKYIHVMRHGLDMAFSDNQHQLEFWGDLLLNQSATPSEPNISFKYWCALHRRVCALGESMGNNFLLLNYDRFCQAPHEGLEVLQQFLGTQFDTKILSKLTTLITPPNTAGRHAQMKLNNIDQEDLELLYSLGYTVTR